MDEFKVGDRVMFKGSLIEQLDFPYEGRVQAWPTQNVRVVWSNGTVSTEPPENLQHVRVSQPETSASTLMSYGAEKAELQRILTKRNATIGRLRAANRELRRELSERDEIKLPPPEHCTPEFIAAFNSAEKREPEPTPLPTVPPRVGGVYRLRDGREAECVKHDTEQSPTLEFLTRTLRTKYEFGVFPSGRFLGHRLDEYDLVAEISPPPETAFAGPLEVGGWYEDEKGRVCHCVSAHWLLVDNDVQFCCDRDNGSDFFRANGRTMSGNGPRIIRKVDPPGGES